MVFDVFGKFRHPEFETTGQIAFRQLERLQEKTRRQAFGGHLDRDGDACPILG